MKFRKQLYWRAVAPRLKKKFSSKLFIRRFMKFSLRLAALFAVLSLLNK